MHDRWYTLTQMVEHRSMVEFICDYIIHPTMSDCSSILVALELRLYILPLAEQSSVGRGRMYDRVVGWGRTGYIGQEGCRGWGRIDEQFSVGRCRMYSRTGIPYPTTSYKSSCIPNTSLYVLPHPTLCSPEYSSYQFKLSIQLQVWK